MAAKTSKSKNSSAKSRKTVASLSKELDALRAEVETLKAAVADLQSQGKQSLSDVAAGAAALAAAVDVATSKAAAPKPVAPKADPMAEVHSLLQQVFKLALTPQPEDPEERDLLFARFAQLVHSDRRGSAILDQSLRSYTWTQLRNKADIYLKDTADVGSYTITRSAPAELDRRASRIKLFLKARTRMPTPISLRRDARAEDAWRIESSSL